MEKKSCLVTGVGWGTGNAIVRRFASSGYNVAMLARRGDRLAEMEKMINGASAYPCDVTDIDSFTTTVKAIESDLGAPSVVIHNAVGGSWGSFLEIDPADLERNFKVNTMALLHLARLTLPSMIEKGTGSLICTGNTSAHRGRARYAGFAPTKAAQRILAQECVALHFLPCRRTTRSKTCGLKRQRGGSTRCNSSVRLSCGTSSSFRMGR